MLHVTALPWQHFQPTIQLMFAWVRFSAQTSFAFESSSLYCCCVWWTSSRLACCNTATHQSIVHVRKLWPSCMADILAYRSCSRAPLSTWCLFMQSCFSETLQLQVDVAQLMLLSRRNYMNRKGLDCCKCCTCSSRWMHVSCLIGHWLMVVWQVFFHAPFCSVPRPIVQLVKLAECFACLQCSASVVLLKVSCCSN